MDLVPRAQGDRLWTIARPFKAAGALEVGARMTILGLEDGGLVLHSPIALTPDDLSAIRALGPVRAIVAPNLYHHVFFAQVAEAFPSAERWAAPGLAWRRKDIAFTGTFGAAEPALPGVEWEAFGGSRLLGEVLFFHRASGALVVTDLFFNVRQAQGAARNYYRLSGAYQRFATSRLVQLAVWDREAARRSAREILSWPVRTITVTHGEVVTDASLLEPALGWLLS